MNSEQFCYWLQGFCELSTDAPTPEQWKAIKEHLATVYWKVTPLAPGDVYRTTPAIWPFTQGPLITC